ncbi:MAG: hypothetical protein IKK02_02385 [Tidjanibacter sp.]|nr:hypothetical protein [Tidjanibacter sp.]
MKQIFKTLVLVAAAVATLTSCEKAPEVTPAAEEFTLTVNATLPAPDGTKTYLGDKVGTEYPVLWSADDKIRVSQVPYNTTNNIDFTAAGSTSSKTSTVSTLSADNTEAGFEFNFGDINKYDSLGNVIVEANFIDYIAIYGGSGYTMYKRDKQYIDLEVVLPTTQKPAAGQFDPTAAIMGDAVLGLDKPATSLDLQFRHLVAYAMLNVKNLNCGSEKVESVTITSAEHKLSGKSYWYYLEGTNFKTTSGDASNKVVIDMTAQTLTNNNFEVYFTATPTEFAVNDKLTFVVATDADNTYTKEVTVESAFEFEQGSILDFSVDFNGVTPDVIEGKQYKLVTDVSTLSAGDVVLLVANNNAAYFAAGAVSTTSTKYLTKVDINAPVSDVITITDEAVDEFTLTASTTPVGAWMLASSLNGGKYVTWTSGNSANVAVEASENTSWNISIADGSATIVNASNSNRYLQYNTGSPRFATYDQTKSIQTPPAIYKKL